MAGEGGNNQSAQQRSKWAQLVRPLPRSSHSSEDKVRGAGAGPKASNQLAIFASFAIKFSNENLAQRLLLLYVVQSFNYK